MVYLFSYQMKLISFHGSLPKKITLYEVYKILNTDKTTTCILSHILNTIFNVWFISNDYFTPKNDIEICVFSCGRAVYYLFVVVCGNITVEKICVVFIYPIPRGIPWCRTIDESMKLPKGKPRVCHVY